MYNLTSDLAPEVIAMRLMTTSGERPGLSPIQDFTKYDYVGPLNFDKIQWQDIVQVQLKQLCKQGTTSLNYELAKTHTTKPIPQVRQ